MGDRTKIEWSDATWNPLRGCSRVSKGCENCYAEVTAARFSGEGKAFEGLATRGPARWTGEVRFIEEHLRDPLRWRRPRKVFVNSVSDLFHEKVPDEWIDRIFAVMALSPRHTFQILTKRPERMRAYFSDEMRPHRTLVAVNGLRRGPIDAEHVRAAESGWNGPLSNVLLGVSVEDQATADERIPLLLQTPAALRWVSYEPALGPVDFVTAQFARPDLGAGMSDALGWIVVGGESGPGARPFDVAWARSAITQCRAAGVPVFVKQLGSRPQTAYSDRGNWPCAGHGTRTTTDRIPWNLMLASRKGGDPAEWPADLRVREFPEVAA